MSLQAMNILERTGVPLCHLTPFSAFCLLKIFFLDNAAALKTSFPPKFSQENLQRAKTLFYLPNCILRRPSNSAHLHSFRSAIKYELRIDGL